MKPWGEDPCKWLVTKCQRGHWHVYGPTLEEGEDWGHSCLEFQVPTGDEALALVRSHLA